MEAWSRTEGVWSRPMAEAPACLRGRWAWHAREAGGPAQGRLGQEAGSESSGPTRAGRERVSAAWIRNGLLSGFR